MPKGEQSGLCVDEAPIAQALLVKEIGKTPRGTFIVFVCRFGNSIERCTE